MFLCDNEAAAWIRTYDHNDHVFLCDNPESAIIFKELKKTQALLYITILLSTGV